MFSRRDFLNSYARRRRGAGNARPDQAAAQANRRMVVDAQIHVWKAESEDWKWVPGLAAAVAGALHHRAGHIDDGRGRRRPRRHRAAVLAGRPQRLCARGGEALSHPLPRHGQAPAAGSQVARPAAEVEGAAGDGRRAGDLQQRPTIPWLTDGTADRFWPAAEKAGLPVMCFAPAARRRSARSPSVTRSSADPRPHGRDGGHGEGQQARGGDRRRPPRSPNTRTSA